MKLVGGVTNCTQLGLHAVNVKYNTKNEKWISIRTYNILPVYFFKHHKE
jgi:hypothetical protein